jgi:uncharacterized membrane protein
MAPTDGKNGPGKSGTVAPAARVPFTKGGPGGTSTNMVPYIAPPRGTKRSLENARTTASKGGGGHIPGLFGELTPSQTNVGSGFNPKDPSNPSQGTGLTGYTGLNPATGMHVATGSPYPPTAYPDRNPGPGGGSGVPQVDMAAILKLLGAKPTQYAPPQQYEYEDLTVPDYAGTGFRAWDGSMYDKMRTAGTEGLAADRRAGTTAYGDARTELSQYQDPFSNRGYTQNQAMPAAMQRMMAANNVQFDPAETARGGQADAAFGNVLALLGGTAQQAQASNMRALAGDERRFGEALASEGRSYANSINMTEAKARQTYEQEKWQYGEDIARSNYEKNTQLAATNSTGRNSAGQSNTQATNDVNQANTKMENDYRTNSANVLIDLIASGKNIDPAILAAYMGG